MTDSLWPLTSLDHTPTSMWIHPFTRSTCGLALFMRVKGNMKKGRRLMIMSERLGNWDRKGSLQTKFKWMIRCSMVIVGGASFETHRQKWWPFKTMWIKFHDHRYMIIFGDQKWHCRFYIPQFKTWLSRTHGKIGLIEKWKSVDREQIWESVE